MTCATCKELEGTIGAVAVAAESENIKKTQKIKCLCLTKLDQAFNVVLVIIMKRRRPQEQLERRLIGHVHHCQRGDVKM